MGEPTRSPSFEVLQEIGLNELDQSSNVDDLKSCLRRLPNCLNGADELDIQAVREAVIARVERLKLVSAPARVVDAALCPQERGTGSRGIEHGKAISIEDPKPADEPQDRQRLLSDLHNLVCDHVSMSVESSVTAALWILWTFVFQKFYVAPLLEISSPTKRCGKTTLLQVLRYSCSRALHCSNISQAALYRTIDKYKPCLLVDEADTFVKRNNELRGVLNSGHTQGAPAVRCVGDDFEPHTFDTFCPKAIAGIGDLPATLRDRAITIMLRRKTSTDKLKPLRLEALHVRGEDLKARCSRWAMDNAAHLTSDPPDVPACLNDRAADNWRPLLAIADQIGGSWPHDAREAARRIAGIEEEQDAAEMLLADIKQLFADADTDRLTSRKIVESLQGMESRPWPEWKHGQPMTPQQLACQLGRFGIRPRTIRIRADTAKGYLSSDFTRAWAEYCPDGGTDPKSPASDPSRPSQLNGDGGLQPFLSRNSDSACDGSKNGSNPHEKRIVTDVTDVSTGERGKTPMLPFES